MYLHFLLMSSWARNQSTCRKATACLLPYNSSSLDQTELSERDMKLPPHLAGNYFPLTSARLSAPDPKQNVRAASDPHPNHIRTTSKPHPNRIRTTSETRQKLREKWFLATHLSMSCNALAADFGLPTHPPPPQPLHPPHYPTT